jgi:two-component system, NtrC family, C4-dicarboxylate transport response regulator DctD
MVSQHGFDRQGGRDAQLSVLVVGQEDPERSVLMHDLIQRRRVLVAWERNLRQARSALSTMRFDAVVTEPDLPDGDGLMLVANRADRLQRWATILLTECTDDADARAALKRGAFAVVDRTGDPQRLFDTIEQACRAGPGAGSMRPSAPRSAPGMLPGCSPTPGAGGEPLLGMSSVMQVLRQQLQRIAPVPADVTIIGETGTGKDLVARQIHAHSGRRGPFIAVNCGAIPDALFESELFGHEVGAFTGATRARDGKIEQSHQGTLFLDEIEAMPLSQQVKLLRVLESRCVDRVGGQGGKALDLRVIAAVQSPLDEHCRQGRFRLDLWHRLNVLALRVPALRDRLEDLPVLFAHYVDDACQRFGVGRVTISAADLERLQRHAWPGNVRELKHGAERHALGLEVLQVTAMVNEGTALLAAQVDACERELIRATLERHEGRLREAAAALGVSERTLSRRIVRHGLPDRLDRQRCAARQNDIGDRLHDEPGPA